jgi:hypothetical protein
MLPTIEPHLPLRPLFVSDFHVLQEAGVFHRSEQVELLLGAVVQRTPWEDTSDRAVEWLHRHFEPALRDGGLRALWDEPLSLPASLSEVHPTFALVAPGAHPRRPDVRLVVDVCDGPCWTEYTHKARAYAEAGVGEYWLVDTAFRLVYQHRLPGEHGFGMRLLTPPGKTFECGTVPCAGVDPGVLLDAVCGPEPV